MKKKNQPEKSHARKKCVCKQINSKNSRRVVKANSKQSLLLANTVRLSLWTLVVDKNVQT